MESSEALSVLAALGQPTRLDICRLLLSRAPEAVAAGDIATQLGVAPNTLSAHLAVVTQAGLATSTRQGRSILYRAEPQRLQALIGYLLLDCCSGRPDLCGPLVRHIEPLIAPSPDSRP